MLPPDCLDAGMFVRLTFPDIFSQVVLLLSYLIPAGSCGDDSLARERATHPLIFERTWGEKNSTDVQILFSFPIRVRPLESRTMLTTYFNCRSEKAFVVSVRAVQTADPSGSSDEVLPTKNIFPWVWMFLPWWQTFWRRAEWRALARNMELRHSEDFRLECIQYFEVGIASSNRDLCTYDQTDLPKILDGSGKRPTDIVSKCVWERDNVRLTGICVTI